MFFLFLTGSLYVCFLVAALYTIRLHMMTGEGIAFLKYFKFFFLSLSAYLLLHIIEVRFGSKLSPEAIKSLYFFIKTALLASSVYASLITFSLYSAQNLKTVEKYLALAALLFLVFLFFDFPTFHGGRHISWDRTISSTLITVAMAASYLSAVIAFYSFAFKRPTEKKKLLMMGTAFLLMFAGGPLHAFGGVSTALIANFIELGSFTLIAIPLFAKTKTPAHK